LKEGNSTKLNSLLTRDERLVIGLGNKRKTGIFSGDVPVSFCPQSLKGDGKRFNK
jgi:hypothetical protein